MTTDKHEILITAAPTDSCWATQYPTATEFVASSIKVEAFSDGERVYSKTLPLLSRAASVEELTLEELDAEVARIEGIPPEGFHPSTNWTQGGPIIDKAHITLIYYGEEHGEEGAPWEAVANSGGHCIDQYPGDATGGGTALIAAMREYVRWSAGK